MVGRYVTGLGSALTVLTLASCASHPVKAPDALAPPPGQVMVLEALGAGSQNYVCQKNEQGMAGWVSTGPQADLFDDVGNRVARHVPGPSWIMGDGSRVDGTVTATVPAPKEEEDIPWLLLSAQNASGSGKLSSIQWIQRLNTRGGRKPDGATCLVGKTAKVPYTATYRFFTAKP